jgi:NifU-like protein
MWEYTDKVKEFFLHPKNVGEMKDADAVGEVGSIVCGDALKLFLKVDKETGRIVDASFPTFGCASAIASSSALTELVKGKTLDEAMGVSNQEIAEFLGGLPDEKMHCSVMGREALEAAIANYKGEAPPVHEGEKVVCKCFDVSEEKIEAILRDIWSLKPPEKPSKPKKLTNLHKIALIQEIIESEIRPGLQADNGDVELIDIEGNKVTVALRGMCTGCLMADVTIRGIQEKLKELVGEEIVVEAYQ